MKHRLIDSLKRELLPLQQAHSNEAANNLFLATVALGICVAQGMGDKVPIVAGSILLTAVMHRRLPRMTPENPQDISLFWLIGNIIFQGLSTFAFSLPALFLAQLGSVATLVVALIWNFGLFTHILSVFSRFPLLNMLNMVPVCATAGFTLYLASQAELRPSSDREWMMAGTSLSLFVVHSFSLLRINIIAARRLEHARRAAQHRSKQLRKLSQKDTLTDLLNRNAFETRLRRVLSQHEGTAVFLIDLDGFKPINDSYSHHAGDAVLIETARRLRHWGGHSTLAARMGGDEFIVALPGLDDPTMAIDLASELRANLAETVFWNGKALQVTASIGVSLSGGGQDVESLCAEADQAMFRAKADPIHGPVLYDLSDFPPRLSLVDRQEMVRAIREQEFRPHYQPKVDMTTGQVVGFEALARWYHPTEGCSHSASFMEQIDELSLHGDFLMSFGRQVLADVRQWSDLGLDPGQVSINLAEANLATRPAAEDLLGMFKEFDDVLSHITIEITEDVFIARGNNSVSRTINRLRDLGLRISLDDFGTGFASLQHLRSVSVDEIKIDVSFVGDLGRDSGTEVLIDGILDIAEGLGLCVIAEGVESEEQAVTLSAMGCRKAQGFLWSRAVPEIDVPALLRVPMPLPGHGTLRAIAGG